MIDGAKVREIREGRLLSQSRLAELAEISREHLCRIENGYSNVSVQTVDKICRVLDVDVSEVWKEAK